MYSRWDGRTWTKPIDIFFAPPQELTPVIVYPHAILDEAGIIHLIWLGEPNAPAYTLFYSSVHASQAGSAQAWRPRMVLADELTGSKYSIHIAFTPPQTIHVIYARVPAGYAPSEERAVTAIRSTDGGTTWSEPLDIFTIPFLDWGASDTRLLVEPPDKVYASWTVWDKTGNGKYVYFARSMDNGFSWDEPIQLAERIDPEYERDWNNLALLAPGQILAMYEGGYRAYRYARYSNDSGATWSEPIDTFPFLIGENGLVEFTRDSLDRLHLFYAQRIREGNEFRGQQLGLWQSIWQGGTNWSEPVLVTRDAAAAQFMTNPKVVVVGGNQVVATWYGSGINEIMVQTGVIEFAPTIPLVSRDIPQPTQSASNEGTEPISTPIAPSNSPFAPINSNIQLPSNNGTAIWVSLMPALLIVISIFSVLYIRNRAK